MYIKKILSLQNILQRTKNGRKINDSCIDLINNAINFGLSAGSFQLNQFTECLNCRIILLNDDFADGCPNCGSKDFSFTYEVDKKRIKKM